MLTLLCMSFSRYSSDTSSCSRSRSRSRGRRHKRTRSKSRGRHSRRSRYLRSASKPRKSHKRSHRSKSRQTHRDHTPERHGRQGAQQHTTGDEMEEMEAGLNKTSKLHSKACKAHQVVGRLKQPNTHFAHIAHTSSG